MFDSFMLQRIMLVDDSEGEALLVMQTLCQAGFEEPVFYLQDSEEALAYLQGEGPYGDRNKFPLPEILLLDLTMPKVDGYQLLRWIRSQPHLGPMFVVALTAEMDPKKIQIAYQLGATSFLSKNGTLSEFSNFVEFFRGFSRIVNAIPEMVKDTTPILHIPAPGALGEEDLKQNTGMDKTA